MIDADLVLWAGVIGAAGAVLGAAVGGLATYLVARGGWRREEVARVTDARKQAYLDLIQIADRLRREIHLSAYDPSDLTLDTLAEFAAAQQAALVWGGTEVRAIAAGLEDLIRALIQRRKGLRSAITERGRERRVEDIRQSDERRQLDAAHAALVEAVRRELGVPL